MESVQNKIVKAALLGAGTVGSGVYELVKERQEDFPHQVLSFQHIFP